MSIVSSTLQVMPVGSTDPSTYYLTMQPATKGLTNAQYAGLNLTYSPFNGNLFAPTITTTNGVFLANGAPYVTSILPTYGGNLLVSSLYVTSNIASGTTTRVEANIPHPFLLMGAA